MRAVLDAALHCGEGFKASIAAIQGWKPGRDSVSVPRAPSVPARRRRLTTWDSALQVEFLKGLCLEKIELELGQRFQRQRLYFLLDFGRQGAELGFH